MDGCQRGKACREQKHNRVFFLVLDQDVDMEASYSIQ